ncbi:unnamed protein product [Adineta steineri]|uniref:Uncharacterized protein n=1 Tax=Adineta steineri TaxID=433720 RepID=A0A813TTV2_9BILA|nr:unnamed protein product [Adineta steineri]
MKRHLNTNEFLSSSPSIHHIRHRKQRHLNKQEILYKNTSVSPVHLHQQIYTSSNSYLKEFNLSEKDFSDLRKALQTIFYCIQPDIINDHKQRLTSPYLQQNNQSFLPLYTNEDFIRNGLLNHNDGPQIYDNYFQSRNLSYSKSSSSTMLTSPMNISLPLALLSNQQHLFTALTSNFISDKSRRSQSNMELNMRKENNHDETESIVIRRNKVQTWKKNNILQQSYSSVQENKQLDISEYHRSSIVRTTSSVIKDDETMKNINSQRSEIKINDDLFPMIKILAPYIIIRDISYLNSNPLLSKNINSNENKQSVNHLRIGSEKRSSNDILLPTFSTAKRRSIVIPSLSITTNQTLEINNNKRIQEDKTNYLLAEFESVLTQISKK